jgi:hypothetical protein
VNVLDAPRRIGLHPPVPWRSYRRDHLTRTARVRVGVAVPGWPQVAGELVKGPLGGDLAVDLSADVPLPLDRGQAVDLTVWLGVPGRVIELPAVVAGEERLASSRRIDFRLVRATA